MQKREWTSVAWETDGTGSDQSLLLLLDAIEQVAGSMRREFVDGMWEDAVANAWLDAFESGQDRFTWSELQNFVNNHRRRDLRSSQSQPIAHPVADRHFIAREIPDEILKEAFSQSMATKLTHEYYHNPLSDQSVGIRQALMQKYGLSQSKFYDLLAEGISLVLKFLEENGYFSD